MDEKDRKILACLRENAKHTTGEIAKRTRIPTTTVYNRIKGLEEDGVVTGYTALVDHGKLGRGIGALIFVTASSGADQDALAKRLLTYPAVEHATIITGGYDIVLEVRVGSMPDLNDLITHEIRNVDGVEKTHTMMMLQEL